MHNAFQHLELLFFSRSMFSLNLVGGWKNSTQEGFLVLSNFFFLLDCGFYVCVCLHLGEVLLSLLNSPCLSGQEFCHTFGECLS